MTRHSVATQAINQWHCRAGGRLLYICEEGLVHYCSQQRGRPGIPLLDYTADDLVREGRKPKGCAPFCTISCVHQTAMLDDFRTKPQATVGGMIDRRRERDPNWRPPLAVRVLDRMFLPDTRTRNAFGAIALRVLRAKSQ